MHFGTVVLVLKMTILIVIVPYRRNHCSLKKKYIRKKRPIAPFVL
jgi:hypothetical protein